MTITRKEKRSLQLAAMGVKSASKPAHEKELTFVLESARPRVEDFGNVWRCEFQGVMLWISPPRDNRSQQFEGSVYTKKLAVDVKAPSYSTLVKRMLSAYSARRGDF